ncbi:MAG: hypothetical protein ACFKPT_22345 [Gloeotrichia echinulata GP01]
MITIDNPVIQQIREIRHQISQNNQHDPQKLIKYYGSSVIFMEALVQND